MKWLQRWFLNRRLAYWRGQVHLYQSIQEALPPRIDNALREHGRAHAAIVWFEIDRPKVTRAMGEPRRAQVTQFQKLTRRKQRKA